MNTETERVTDDDDNRMGSKAHRVGGSTITTPEPHVIHVERTFAAPRDRVWRAYTDRDQVAQWWGRGHDLDIEKMDMRAGGEWRFVEHAPDGDTGFSGSIVEVTPQSRIVQTFGWDEMKGRPIRETAEFENLGERTLVKSTMVFDSEEERDAMMRMGMADGMEQSYAALEKVLARK
jgi:uncharacterized protein YndB with AHSA1/START domain